MNDLRVFVMVAQLRSIRNTATLLHMSDDAVSRTIERVERESNCRLFTRHNRGGLRLTPTGKDLLELVLPMVPTFGSLPI